MENKDTLIKIEEILETGSKFKVKGSENLNRWAARYATISATSEETYKKAKDRNMGRYVAVNLENCNTVEFRLFHATLHAGKVRAYINLCLAMNAQAINSKRASAEVLDNGNDKYAMRCWLLRLGFIGDEWKNVREHLTKNLTGNAAWRNAPETYESYNRRTRTA